MRKDSVRSDTGFDSGLAPVIGRAPVLLILGSFPSRRSLEQREYYAHPRNQFWQILQTLFGIGRNLEYRVKIDDLIRNRIALWDVIGACYRAGSADHRITGPSLNPVQQLLTSCPTIRGIACNGTTAARYVDGSVFYPTSGLSRCHPQVRQIRALQSRKRLNGGRSLKRSSRLKK